MSNSTDYTAAYGVLQLLRFIDNDPALGTGVLQYSIQGHNLLGPNLPPVLIDGLILTQFNLFGGYPGPSDVAPLLSFLVRFL